MALILKNSHRFYAQDFLLFLALAFVALHLQNPLLIVLDGFDLNTAHKLGSYENISCPRFERRPWVTSVVFSYGVGFVFQCSKAFLNSERIL